jgi:hypothetical protein
MTPLQVTMARRQDSTGTGARVTPRSRCQLYNLCILHRTVYGRALLYILRFCSCSTSSRPLSALRACFAALQDDPRLHDVNVRERVDKFVEECNKLFNVTRGDDIMLTMGTDFTVRLQVHIACLPAAEQLYALLETAMCIKNVLTEEYNYSTHQSPPDGAPS